jgi:hypothetical protein
MAEKREGNPGVPIGDLLHGHYPAHIVGSGSPVLGSHKNAKESRLGQLEEHLLGKGLFLIPLPGPRNDLLGSELPNGLLEHPLLLVQLKIHQIGLWNRVE